MAMQLMLLDLQERINDRAFRRERVFHDRGNPFDIYDDVQMYEEYRFTRLGCRHIIDLLEPYIKHPTKRNHALPASIQVFVALKFYGSGLLKEAKNSNIHQISKATASRVVRRVTMALCEMRNAHIRFPTSPAEVLQTQRKFFNVAGFPGIVGVVDGTLVGLHGCNYGEDEYVFVSRKGPHAINTQLICDSTYRITNVVARWPGSTHDSRVFQASLVGRQFEAGQLQGTLLGDSGYTLKPYMMTPLLHPSTPTETAYNNAQTKTRNLIEQVNGQLKNKFRCLIGHGMQIEPSRASDIIVACCVLYNISKDLKEPHLDPQRDQPVPPEPVAAVADNNDIGGVAAMAALINNFFAQG